MDDFRKIKDSFKVFLLKKIGKNGFSVHYDSDCNAHFVVDVDKRDFKKACQILPEKYEGIFIDVRQVKTSKLFTKWGFILKNISYKKLGFNLHTDSL